MFLDFKGFDFQYIYLKGKQLHVLWIVIKIILLFIHMNKV